MLLREFISEIVKKRKKSDKSSKMQLRAKIRDKYQNSWFKKQNLKLFRIIENVDQEIWMSDLRSIINDI